MTLKDYQYDIIEQWCLPTGSGKKEMRSYRLGQTAENPEGRLHQFEAYVTENETMNLLVQHPESLLWVHAGECIVDVNYIRAYINPRFSSAAEQIYSYAGIYGRMFGSAVRVYRKKTGAFVGETEKFPAVGAFTVSHLKYSGWDNDYYGDVKLGKNNVRNFLIKGSHIYWKTKTSGLVSFEYIKSELDAEERMRKDFIRESGIKAAMSAEDYVALAPEHGDILKINGFYYQYDDKTEYPYSSRWLMKQPDDSWNEAGATTNDLLDQYCGLPQRSYSEWSAIGRSRRNADS